MPVQLKGRDQVEAIAPITYFSKLSSNNGAITDAEAQAWLDRLVWEEEAGEGVGSGETEGEPTEESESEQESNAKVTQAADSNVSSTASTASAATNTVSAVDAASSETPVLGTLLFYVCSGKKPATHSLPFSVQRLTADQCSAHAGGPPASLSPDLTASADAPASSSSASVAAVAEEVAELVNATYNVSDTGITLSSPRIPQSEVEGMIQRGELFVARHDETGEILGVIQTEVKGTGVHAGLPVEGSMAEARKVGEFSMLAVKSHGKSCEDVGGSGRGVGKLLVQAAEAHCRSHGCTLMQLGILCPDDEPDAEPEYKKWLQRWYLKLGYEHRETITLRFRPDEVKEMYSYLGQLNPCKYILFDKAL